MSDMTIEAMVPAVRAGDGEARWWWGNLAILKLTGDDTGGGLAVAELTIAPDRMVPLHVHHREEETFLVTAGHLTFEVGERTIEAAPGDFVVGPRGIPHRFTAGPQGATVLLILTPAGLEGLILEQSVAATRPDLPGPGDVPPPDIERMREVALRYGCELLA